MVIKVTDTAPALKIYTKPGQVWPIANCVQQKKEQGPPLFLPFREPIRQLPDRRSNLAYFCFAWIRGCARIFYFKAALEMFIADSSDLIPKRWNKFVLHMCHEIVLHKFKCLARLQPACSMSRPQPNVNLRCKSTVDRTFGSNLHQFSVLLVSQ